MEHNNHNVCYVAECYVAECNVAECNAAEHMATHKFPGNGNGGAHECTAQYNQLALPEVIFVGVQIYAPFQVAWGRVVVLG